MTPTETLTKAIEKAIENGWDGKPPSYNLWASSVIYNHDFAKCLWGETVVNNMPNKYDLLSTEGLVYAYDNANESFEYDEPIWMWHLQQMVISPDPIKYLAQHMEDK